MAGLPSPARAQVDLDDTCQLIGTGETAHIIRPLYGLEMPVEELISDHRRWVIALFEMDLIVTPGALDILAEARARGRLAAVATNSRSNSPGGASGPAASAPSGRVGHGRRGEESEAGGRYLPDRSDATGAPPSQCLAIEDSPPG